MISTAQNIPTIFPLVNLWFILCHLLFCQHDLSQIVSIMKRMQEGVKAWNIITVAESFNLILDNG